MKTKLTASIVLFNTPKEQLHTILQCVEESLVDRVFVIDNSSCKASEEICKQYSKVEYQTHENTGYGSSHNIGIKKSIELNADYHVILNPDIRFERNVLSELADFMDSNPDAVYVLPKVIYPNGELQYLCKLLPTPSDLIFRRFLPKTKYSERKNDLYCLKHSGYNKIMNPPCLSGCFMFMRTKTLKDNNIFFDDRFFMYFEDFDLIRRLHTVGKTIFYPNVTIIHDHAKESYKSKRMLLIHIKSAFKYFNKWGWFFDFERNKINKHVLKTLGYHNKK